MTLPFLPDAASTLAAKVDTLFAAMTLVTGTVAVVIVLLLIVFSYRYRRNAQVDRERAPADTLRRTQRRIEIAWVSIPLLLFFAAFGWAAALYYEHAAPPDDALEIAVVAKQWMWKSQHASGQREIDELHVPAGIPVKLIMTSQDVIHSFYIPAFRVKQDVLPGRYTVLWFTATQTGNFHLFCAEYCGTDHSRMGGRIVVESPVQFQRWLNTNNAEPTMAAHGEALFRALGCSGCHGANASIHAPSFDGLYGRPVQLSNGQSVVADERYIRDSILLPAREVVAGYQPIMPSFAGQVSEADILDLIAYIKSLATKKEARQK